MERLMKQGGPDWVKGIAFPPLFLNPADRLFSLNAGDELFNDAADAEVNEKMQFSLGVAVTPGPPRPRRPR